MRFEVTVEVRLHTGRLHLPTTVEVNVIEEVLSSKGTEVNVVETQYVSEKSLEQRAAKVAPLYVRLINAFMPANTPRFFVRAEGARLWDLNGREYIDFMCAGGPNLLGYHHPYVEAAAERQRALGDTMTGPAAVLVELAEKLVETVSHADWVLFAKNGGDSTTTALRIARAQTGRRRVLVAEGSYHGSASWCTPFTAGVLPEERVHRTEYKYNDVASLEAAVEDAGDDLAAIFATGIKHDSFTDQELPKIEFARRCRELCDRTGALLVVDDIRAGFRLARDCSWALMGVKPDLSCWSKAIANGYALSVVLGSERAREGLSKALVVGTFWLQAVPMAAALATLEVITGSDYLERISELGAMLRAGLEDRATAHGFELSQSGPPQMPLVRLKSDPDNKFGMAFVSAMLERGVYMSPFHNMFLCSAMTTHDITQTIDAADRAFVCMAESRRKIESSPVPLVFRDSMKPR